MGNLASTLTRFLLGKVKKHGGVKNLILRYISLVVTALFVCFRSGRDMLCYKALLHIRNVPKRSHSG